MRSTPYLVFSLVMNLGVGSVLALAGYPILALLCGFGAGVCSERLCTQAHKESDRHALSSTD